MEQIARVTKVFTKGFVKVVYKDGQKVCSQSCELCPGNGCPALEGFGDSAVAQDSLDTGYGDIVVIKPLKSRTDKRARAAYIIPVIMFILGYLIGAGKNFSVSECILSGMILGVIACGISWIMNRRARLQGKMRFEVVRVLKRYQE